MRDLLEKKLGRFEELEQLLVNPEVLTNSPRLAAVAREHGALSRLASKYRRFKELIDEINGTREMVGGPDAELRELAAAEMPALIEDREKLWNELLELTLGGEDANRSR